MKKLLQALKRIIDVIAVILTGRDDSAVNADICDYSGQGRDKYGR